MSAFFNSHNHIVVRSLTSFRRFLVVSDIHIGDAIMTQSALTAVRDFFPGAQVDYVVNKTAFSVMEGHPEATRVVPFFSSGAFPSLEDLKALKTMIRDGHYDLALNFSPFIKDRDIALQGTKVLNFMTNAPAIIRNEMHPSEINHFAFQTYEFIGDLLSLVAVPVRERRFQGLRLTLSDSAAAEALRFFSDARLPSGVPVVMFNPDAATHFTRMPFEKQARLLDRLAESRISILLGAGHTEAGIGERLKASLPSRLGRSVRIIPPSLSLEIYTALIDLCDVFVSGDTGPLHLAAARKYSRSGRHAFRNRTAVLSFFGATPARMSGYDSFQPGYLPANQDAPSRSYTAGSPCRNITCLNKLYKNCRTVRCFVEVDIDGLANFVMDVLNVPADETPERELPAAAR